MKYLLTPLGEIRTQPDNLAEWLAHTTRTFSKLWSCVEDYANEKFRSAIFQSIFMERLLFLHH